MLRRIAFGSPGQKIRNGTEEGGKATLYSHKSL